MLHGSNIYSRKRHVRPIHLMSTCCLYA